MRKMFTALITMLALMMTGCGFNKIQSAEEQVKASWAEVLNQYQRRADLVPNLVSTVKGYASHESDVLTTVTNARAKVGTLQVGPELINNPDAFGKFQSAQKDLSASLSKLIAISESYPELKADSNFRDLQAQLEGTENRITVARNRYIKSVQDYNVIIRSFPSNLTAIFFGYTTKPSFAVSQENEVAKPPKVDFSSKSKP